MSQMKNVKHSKKKSGAASPEIGVGTHSYGKSPGYKTTSAKGINKSKKGAY